MVAFLGFLGVLNLVLAVLNLAIFASDSGHPILNLIAGVFCVFAGANALRVVAKNG